MMQIDVSLLISIVALAVTAVVGFSGLKRNRSTDDKNSAAEMTAVMIKLETMNTSLIEMKAEMKANHRDYQEMRDKLIIVEQSTKSAHHRIDTITHKEE